MPVWNSILKFLSFVNIALFFPHECIRYHRARSGHVVLFGIDGKPEELLKVSIAPMRKVRNFLGSWTRAW